MVSKNHIVALKLEGRILLKRQKEKISKNVRVLYDKSEASYFPTTCDFFFFKQSSKLVLIMFTFPNEEKETQMCS